METTENQNHPNAKHSSRENDYYDDEGDKPRDMTDITTAKYSWGPRAHKEYSKYAMLKFVVAVSLEETSFHYAYVHIMVVHQL